MAPTNLCRLCVDICPESKSLFDENGLGTELYKITFEYFHPAIVNLEEAQHLTTICIPCWQHICDFQTFQNSILMAQSKLSENKQGMQLKTEEELQELKKVSQVVVKKEPDLAILDQVDNNMEMAEAAHSSLEVNSVAQKRKSISKVDEISKDDELRLAPTNPRIMDGGDFESEFSSDDDVVVPWAKCQTKSSSNRAKVPWWTSADGLYTFPYQSPQEQINQRLENFLLKWMPTIECGACPETFPKLSLLQDHFRHKHAAEEFHITCCSRKLSKEYDIQEHLLYHDDPVALECWRCGKSFTCKSGLYRHIERQHPEEENGMFVCNICGKGHKTRWGLKYHYHIMHYNVIRPEEINELITSAGPIANSSFTHAGNEVEFEEPAVKVEKDFSSQPMATTEINDYRGFEMPVVKVKNEFNSLPTEAVFSGEQEGYGVVDSFQITSVASQADGSYVPDPRDQHMLLTRPKLEIMDVPSDNDRSSDDYEEETMALMSGESPQDHNPKRQYLKLDDLLSKWMPNIKCVACPEQFSNLTVLQEHFAQNHPNEEFHIFCCARKLRQRLQIKDHLLLHSNPDSFKCERCSKSYATNKGLKRHMGRRHPETQCIKFVCKICGIGLKSKGGLKLHHTTMHSTEALPEEVIQLNECLQAKTARRLKRAERRAKAKPKEKTGNTEKRPPFDGKDLKAKLKPSCPLSEEVEQHRTSHNSDIPTSEHPLQFNDDRPGYTCQACGQVSKTETSFYHHMWFIHRIHLKRLCTTCGRGFKRTRDLLEHMASHQKRDIYACAFCSLTFRKIHSVIAHRRKAHPQESNKNFYKKID